MSQKIKLSKLNDTTKDKIEKEINDLSAKISNAGYDFYGVSASLDDQIQDFRHNNQSMFPYYTVDETTLKTIVRSNPGLLMLKKGVILGKWHCDDLPSFEEIEEIKKGAS